MSKPVWKRYKRGECTNCGRPRDREVWCSRCVETASRRPARARSYSPAEWDAYLDALMAWARA